MFTKLNEVEKKYQDLTHRLGDPIVHADTQQFQVLAREEARLRPLIESYRLYKERLKQLADNKLLLTEDDASIREMAKEEIPHLEIEIARLAQQLKVLLLPKDPNDEKNIYLEIRAGTGGEESGLFVANLFRMYSRYAEDRGWRIELMSSNPTGLGGFKEIIALISGEKVYSYLKHESGVHRVQRVPDTEASGRIHTSAVTVAVIPEADDVDIKIEEKDLRIDVFRSGGHGGQSVNTTDSAVRITYLPTNLVVICQDEKSQHKNRAKAMKVLRARLYDQMLTERQAKEAAERRSQIKTGDRSEKIRTYNFPQSRVTDHRIGLTIYQLDTVMEGHLDLLIEPLQAHYQAEALKSQEGLG